MKTFRENPKDGYVQRHLPASLLNTGSLNLLQIKQFELNWKIMHKVDTWLKGLQATVIDKFSYTMKTRSLQCSKLDVFLETRFPDQFQNSISKFHISEFHMIVYQGYQWPYKKGLMSSNSFLKDSFHFGVFVCFRLNEV